MWAPPAAPAGLELTLLSVCPAMTSPQHPVWYAGIPHPPITQLARWQDFPRGHIGPDLQYRLIIILESGAMGERHSSLSAMSDWTPHYDTMEMEDIKAVIPRYVYINAALCERLRSPLSLRLFCLFMCSWKGVIAREGLAQVVSQVRPLQQAPERWRPRWGQWDATRNRTVPSHHYWH